MRKLEKQQCSAQGVIVTLYEESSEVGSRPLPRARPPKIGTTIAKPTTSRSCGYDRRAELLAYAHQLRKVDPRHIHHQQDHSCPPDTYHLPDKPKKRRRLLGRLKALKFSFGRLFKGEKKAWKYEHIETSTGGSCSPRYRGRNRWNLISERLRRLLKRFSCGCKRRKGVDHEGGQYQDLHSAQHGR